MRMPCPAAAALGANGVRQQRERARALRLLEELAAAGEIARPQSAWRTSVGALLRFVAARGLDGQIAAYPLTENVHRNHILHTSSAPAKRDDGSAARMAGQILEHLGYVGVMGVEFFQMKDGKLIVNEIAPRVHNSGHWTQNGCVIDQFEQHIRAVAGWPLGDGERHSNVVMTNLIGDAVLDVATLSKDASVGLHLYGKADAKAGRKMGHMNKITGPV